MNFAFTNLVAPVNATVVATLYAPDGSTVVATLTLTPTVSGATTYSGSVAISPTPADSTSVAYTFKVLATTTAGTVTIWPAGSFYGYVYDGQWYSDTVLFPPPAGQTTVTGATINRQGEPVGNASVAFRAKYIATEIAATSDANGNVSIDLLQAQDYLWVSPGGSCNYFTTPASSLLSLGNMIGDWEA